MYDTNSIEFIIKSKKGYEEKLLSLAQCFFSAFIYYGVNIDYKGKDEAIIIKESNKIISQIIQKSMEDLPESEYVVQRYNKNESIRDLFAKKPGIAWVHLSIDEDWTLFTSFDPSSVKKPKNEDFKNFISSFPNKIGYNNINANFRFHGNIPLNARFDKTYVEKWIFQLLRTDKKKLLEKSKTYSGPSLEDDIVFF